MAERPQSRMHAVSRLGRTRSLVLAILLGISGDGFGQAQAPAAPTTPSTQAAAEPRREQPNFVGNSYNLDSTGVVLVRRRFEPAARTSWHAHTADFVLVVEDGRARVQRKGEPMKELRKGETDFTPAGVMHWHGAAPNEAFTQLGVAYGPGIQYGERVTDEEYSGKT